MINVYEGKNRGTSPVMGLVLLVVMVLIGSALVFLTGSALIDGLQSQTYEEQSERDLKRFDSELATLGWQGDTPQTVYFGDQFDGDVVDDGELTITVSDGYQNDTSSIPLKAVVATDDGGNEFAYQAGGIWKLSGEYPTPVSNPNIEYYTEQYNGEQVGRIDVDPITVEGNVGAGEHSVTDYNATALEFDSNITYVNYVTIEVENTAYHHGWYDFLKSEFDATDEAALAGQDCDVSESLEENVICHDEAGQTVTVVAAIDGETSLASLVDIEPTIYGGLYAEGTEADLRSSLNVSGYDDHDTTTNVSDDLFVANYDTYNLHNHAEIDGIPVVNGELSSKGNPEVSPIGYGVSVDPGPRGKKFDEDDDAYWLDAHKEALATELSSSYDDIEPIDDEIDTVLTEYLDGHSPADGDVTAGSYTGTGTVRTLDSSDGDVHVGVDGTVDLSNVDVTGDNRTSFYVDGTVDLSNVEITPDDRANALWIYATSDSKITIGNEFQGVVYAPGAEVEIADGTSVDGAVVAGPDSEIGDDVEIRFDRSLRTDTPLSEADEDLLFEYSDSRPPIDGTFILDSSGSMGPHNTNSDVYEPIDSVGISGADWEPIPVDEPFRNDGYRTVEVRNTTTTERQYLSRREFAHPGNWDEIRVVGNCWGQCTTDLGLYEHAGNDPKGLRVDATRHFVDLMDDGNGDRVGVYEFDRNGDVLHELDDDLEGAKESVENNGLGGTNMAAGLELALDDYEDSELDDQERVAVLLSDGENNNPSDDRAMNEQVERAKELDVTLHTIGLDGREQNSIPEDKLETWATETGGSFHKADNATELFDLFENIAREEVQVDAETQVEISVTHDRAATAGYAVSVSERTVVVDS